MTGEPGAAAGPAAPAISVVIPTRNRAAYLRDALEAIRDGEFQDFEVWVVDQSDGDDTQHLVREFDSRMRYLRIDRRGACPARNIGAASARADLIAFTDDDCVPNADWLARIVQAFATDPGLEFVFGELKAPAEPRSGGGYPEALFPPHAGLARTPRKIVTMGAGANMSCRASFLYRAGGFDDVLGRHDARVMNADVSMAYKAYRQARWIASPDIQVVHEHGFRPQQELAALMRAYAFELGANYGRLTRRRDFVATRLFARELTAALWRAVRSAARGERPHGLRSAIAYAHSFALGLLVPARAGYVDGNAMRALRRDYAAADTESAPTA